MIRPIDIMLSFSCTVMGSNCIVTGYAITMTYSHGIVIELQNPAHPTNAYFVSLPLLATGRFRPLTSLGRFGYSLGCRTEDRATLESDLSAVRCYTAGRTGSVTRSCSSPVPDETLPAAQSGKLRLRSLGDTAASQALSR